MPKRTQLFWFGGAPVHLTVRSCSFRIMAFCLLSSTLTACGLGARFGIGELREASSGITAVEETKGADEVENNSKEQRPALTVDPSAVGETDEIFVSLAKAIEAAEPGATIVLKPGRYKENIIITKDGIKLKAAAPGVVFDGTEAVKLEKIGDSKILGTVLPENFLDKGKRIEQVFNEQRSLMLWEARWPNAPLEKVWVHGRTPSNGWASVGQGTGILSETEAHIVHDTNGPRSLGVNDDVMIVYNYFSQFRTIVKPAKYNARTDRDGFALRFPLTSNCSNKGSTIVSEVAPCQQRNNASWWEDDFFYMFGHRSFLDQEGEWYFDEVERRLLVMGSSQGETVHVKVRPYAITIKGAKNVEIDGIEFFATALRSEPEEDKDTSHLKISGNVFNYPSWDRLIRDNWRLANPKAGQPNYKDRIPLTDGISLRGHHITFENNQVRKGGTYGVLLDGKHNTVQHNVISDTNWFGEIDHAPIVMTDSKDRGRRTPDGFIPPQPVDGKILSNSIYNFGNVGIRHFGPRIEVGFNNVFNGGLLSLDTSMIYTAGTHNQGTRVHHNLVHNGTGIGIRLDGWSVTETTVDHNIIWNTPMGMKISGFANRVINNTIDVANPNYALLVEWGREERGDDRGLQNRETFFRNNLAYRLHTRSSSDDQFSDIDLTTREGPYIGGNIAYGTAGIGAYVNPRSYKPLETMKSTLRGVKFGYITEDREYVTIGAQQFGRKFPQVGALCSRFQPADRKPKVCQTQHPGAANQAKLHFDPHNAAWTRANATHAH